MAKRWLCWFHLNWWKVTDARVCSVGMRCEYCGRKWRVIH